MLYPPLFLILSLLIKHNETLPKSQEEKVGMLLGCLNVTSSEYPQEKAKHRVT
jgi:hypothetical protein